MRKVRGFEVVEDEFRKHKDKEVKLPRRATSKSAGYDMYSPVRAVVNPHESIFVASDIRAYMQDDEELRVIARSGLGLKGIILRNGTGLVDADYFDNLETGGNIGISIWNTTDNPFIIEEGDRICQASFHKYLIVDNDEPLKSDRTGGFGSTGIR